MRALGLLGLLMWQAGAATEPPRAQPDTMRYERAIAAPAGPGQACALLDAAVFPHAAPSLADLRLFARSGDAMREVPYVITMSQTATEQTEAARVLNLRVSGRAIGFDLEMPSRPYTAVTLEVDPAVHDFVATAEVTGEDSLAGKGTALGSFTVFDLASQHLSRDTTLRLAESSFRYLHVVLRVSPVGRGAGRRFEPGAVVGADVPPSREDQVLYTTVASATAATTGAQAGGGWTRFDLTLAARAPVERVSFDLATGAANFSRRVTISASPEGAAGGAVESVSGTITRVHAVEAGRAIERLRLSVPAVLGANLQGPAHVWVEVEDGGEAPLPISAVRLEMRQRRLCFDAPAEGGVALFYGDASLIAPAYEYQRTFRAERGARVASFAPEAMNPGFRERPAALKPFGERHPEVLWMALIGVVCGLGTAALKLARTASR